MPLSEKPRFPARIALAFPVLILIAACATTTKKQPEPPSDTTTYLPPPGVFHTDKKLVKLRTTIPGIAIELPYATRRNVAHSRLYPKDMAAMLDPDTASRLKRAQRDLAKSGRGLKVWDAYRPPEVQWELWRRSGKSGYVADPRQWWSKHCSGRAVDVTLVDLKTGNELPMPSRFDDFSKQASSNYTGDNPAIRENLRLLKGAMKRAGFIGIEMEWWHFANVVHYEKNIAPIPAATAGVDLSHLGKIKTF